MAEVDAEGTVAVSDDAAVPADSVVDGKAVAFVVEVATVVVSESTAAADVDAPPRLTTENPSFLK